MLTVLSENTCFEGRQLRIEHESSSCNCTMTFSIFVPPQALEKNSAQKCPVVYWLSGLTCTDENFVHKAGAQRIAAELGLIIVCPDTSPRGDSVPDDTEAAWDFGLGAGFYVDASETPWSEHYQMYTYITEELPELIEANFPVTEQRAISGHSMGGHGALTIALKNTSRYQSASAFAPIASPMHCPWGIKALSNYLGEANEENLATWASYDSCALIELNNAQQGDKIPLLIDQGDNDCFLDEQLQPERLLAACQAADHPIDYRLRPGYDHSYYYIASFIEEHLRYHAKHLKQQ